MKLKQALDFARENPMIRIWPEQELVPVVYFDGKFRRATNENKWMPNVGDFMVDLEFLDDDAEWVVEML